MKLQGSPIQINIGNLNVFISFVVASATGGFVLRDFLNGFLSEWVKDFWAERKRVRKLRYNQGKKLLKIITPSTPINYYNGSLHTELSRFKYHIRGHSKKVFDQITLFGRILGKFKDEADRLLKTGGYFTPEDMHMFGEFSEHISIMTEGLSIEAHYLMGNNKFSYLFQQFKFKLFGRWILKRIEKNPVSETLQEAIDKSVLSKANPR